jgi:hypothetical protein
MPDGRDHIVEKDNAEQHGNENDKHGNSDNTEDHKTKAGVAEVNLVLQARNRDTNLHRTKHEAEPHKHDQYPTYASLEESFVPIVAVEVATDKMCEHEPYAVHRIYPVQAQLAEVIPPIDLVKAVHVDCTDDLVNNRFPLKPCQPSRQQVLFLGNLKVNGTSD